MEDIVNRLRSFKSAAAQSWAHEAATEIESLRAQLAEVTKERDEFKEAHKFTFEQYQDCGRLLNETCAQLEATHAHAARLVEAMKTVKSNLMHQRRFGTDTYQAWKNAVARAEGDIEEILDSTPINLDAMLSAPAPADTAVKDAETEYAIKESLRINSCEEYFNARPQLDSLHRRRVFEGGFNRGYDAAMQATERMKEKSNETF